MPPLWQESERKVKVTPAGIWLTSSRTSSSVVNPDNIPQHTPTTQDLICEHWNAQEKSVATKVRTDKLNNRFVVGKALKSVAKQTKIHEHKGMADPNDEEK
jgi:hypothetical protein